MDVREMLKMTASSVRGSLQISIVQLLAEFEKTKNAQTGSAAEQK